MESENKYVDGDILKKDVISREAWIVVVVDGELMLQPLTSSKFPDTTLKPLRLGDDLLKYEYIKLASASMTK